MSQRHEAVARSLSAESRKALMNRHENGYVPAPTDELTALGIVREAYLSTFGEAVRFYVMDQELEGLG